MNPAEPKHYLWIAVVATLLAWSCAGHASPDSDAATVVYVDSVDCVPGSCEARRKSLPVEELVRERYAGDVCIEYRRWLTGFLQVPSRDPRQPIDVPQYRQERPVQVACPGAVPARRLAKY